jgi:hypothetical protein
MVTGFNLAALTAGKYENIKLIIRTEKHIFIS